MSSLPSQPHKNLRDKWPDVTAKINEGNVQVLRVAWSRFPFVPKYFESFHYINYLERAIPSVA